MKVKFSKEELMRQIFYAKYLFSQFQGQGYGRLKLFVFGI